MNIVIIQKLQFKCIIWGNVDILKTLHMILIRSTKCALTSCPIITSIKTKTKNFFFKSLKLDFSSGWRDVKSFILLTLTWLLIGASQNRIVVWQRKLWRIIWTRLRVPTRCLHPAVCIHLFDFPIDFCPFAPLSTPQLMDTPVQGPPQASSPFPTATVLGK